jgi:uncharacterized protein
MELIRTKNERIEKLTEYLESLGKGIATKKNFDQYDDILSTATAFEVNAALHQVLSREESVTPWKVPVARFIRSVSKGLDAETLPIYPAGHLLAKLDAENDRILAALAAVQKKSTLAQKGEISMQEIRESVGAVDMLADHYVILQNELFPLFEKSSKEYACVKLMWEIEDDAIALAKKLTQEKTSSGYEIFWKLLGEFVLTVNALIYRERRILFPMAFRAMAPDAFSNSKTAPAALANQYAFMTKTGTLSSEQLEAIFLVLPIDVAFIGSDDRVKFYSDPPHRIFPRSPAVIGRLVQNCHPPKSVATVERILESFKKGKEDSAEFWLSMDGKFIHIQYYAIRDEYGEYMGTLEVSQDATHLRALYGEKRLL